MRNNSVKTIWQNGGAAINGWLHIPSTWTAEVMAHQGFDSLTIDLEHGLMGVETAIQMLQAISTTDVVPFFRSTWNDPAQIQKMLDGGAYGVICPMVNNRAECEQFVGAVRYPPLGYRSMGPTRARFYAGADYGEKANTEVVALAMVETPEAVRNLEAILTVPGLDGVFVGPGDLSLTLSVENPALTDADFLSTIEHILATAKHYGKVGGIFATSTGYAVEMMQRGFQFVTVLTDTMLMTSAARAAVETVRNA